MSSCVIVDSLILFFDLTDSLSIYNPELIGLAAFPAIVLHYVGTTDLTALFVDRFPFFLAMTLAQLFLTYVILLTSCTPERDFSVCSTISIYKIFRVSFRISLIYCNM